MFPDFLSYLKKQKFLGLGGLKAAAQPFLNTPMDESDVFMLVNMTEIELPGSIPSFIILI